LGKQKNQTIYNVSNTVARSAFGFANGVVPIVPKLTDSNLEFIEWSWSIIQRLQLYAPQQINNIYSLSGTGEAPFEALESANLSTIRLQGTLNPLAAYIMLMLSEIGHSFGSFQDQKQGWILLRVIQCSGRYLALLNATFLLFKTFYSTIGPSVIDSVEFESLFESFWKNMDKTSISSIHSFVRKTIAESISNSSYLNNSVAYCFNFWSSIAFANKGWMHSKYCLSTLNLISQLALENNRCGYVVTLLSHEYQKLITSYSTQESSGGFIASRLKSIYGFASGALGNLMNVNHSPSLVVHSDILLSISGNIFLFQ
jgi:hypothetical protein